jgi:flagellar biosynthetic protein FlhB
MAEEEGQLRTEEPTPRRREEARKRGQIPFSPELTAAAVLMAGVLFLKVAGGSAGERLLDIFRFDFRHVPTDELSVAAATDLAGRLFGRLTTVLGTFFAIAVAAAIGAATAQLGLRFLPERLAPDFERISPSAGLARLLSMQSAKRALLAMMKATVLAVIAWLVIRSRAGAILGLGRGTPADAIASGWEVCLRMLLYLAGALLVVGIIDYAFQWRRIENALRMTKQEVKEEVKREEGDPLIRARIRTLQRLRAKQRALALVPRATVVVTNPIHYAVALRYDRASDSAPVVVAKGAGVMARQISEVARRHAVPVLERPPLARALFAGVKEGQEIPPGLFRAVAEVIAFVFRLRGAA